MSSLPQFLNEMNTWRSSKVFPAVAVATAIFTDVFLYGVVVPVFPYALTERIGVPADQVQSRNADLLAVFGVALFPGSIIFGWAADHMSSRKAVLLVGLVLIFAATFLLAVGRTLTVFMIARALQGLSASIVWSSGVALLTDTFGPKRVGEVTGYVMLCQTVALVISPEVGGLVFAKAGYNAVFGLCLGLVGLDIILRLLIIEKPRLERDQDGHDGVNDINNTSDDLNRRGSILSTSNDESSSEGSPLLTKHDHDHDKSTTADSWWAFIILLSSPRILAGLFCLGSVGAIWTTFDAVLPIFVQKFFGWGPLGAGLIFIPLVLPAFASPMAGRWGTKYGERKVVIILFALGVPTLACFLFIQGDSMGHVVLLNVLLFLAGTVMQLTIPPATADLTHAMDELGQRPENRRYFGSRGAYGRGYGVINCAFAAGTLAGPSVAGILMSRGLWWVLPVLLAGVALLDGVVAMLFVGRSVIGTQRKGNDGDVNNDDINNEDGSRG